MEYRSAAGPNWNNRMDAMRRSAFHETGRGTADPVGAVPAVPIPIMPFKVPEKMLPAKKTELPWGYEQEVGTLLARIGFFSEEVGRLAKVEKDKLLQIVQDNTVLSPKNIGDEIDRMAGDFRDAVLILMTTTDSELVADAIGKLSNVFDSSISVERDIIDSASGRGTYREMTGRPAAAGAADMFVGQIVSAASARKWKEPPCGRRTNDRDSGIGYGGQNVGFWQGDEDMVSETDPAHLELANLNMGHTVSAFINEMFTHDIKSGAIRDEDFVYSDDYFPKTVAIRTFDESQGRPPFDRWYIIKGLLGCLLAGALGIGSVVYMQKFVDPSQFIRSAVAKARGLLEALPLETGMLRERLLAIERNVEELRKYLGMGLIDDPTLVGLGDGSLKSLDVIKRAAVDRAVAVMNGLERITAGSFVGRTLDLISEYRDALERSVTIEELQGTVEEFSTAVIRLGDAAGVVALSREEAVKVLELLDSTLFSTVACRTSVERVGNLVTTLNVTTGSLERAMTGLEAIRSEAPITAWMLEKVAGRVLGGRSFVGMFHTYFTQSFECLERLVRRMVIDLSGQPSYPTMVITFSSAIFNLYQFLLTGQITTKFLIGSVAVSAQATEVFIRAVGAALSALVRLFGLSEEVTGEIYGAFGWIGDLMITTRNVATHLWSFGGVMGTLLPILTAVWSACLVAGTWGIFMNMYRYPVTFTIGSAIAILLALLFWHRGWDWTKNAAVILARRPMITAGSLTAILVANMYLKSSGYDMRSAIVPYLERAVHVPLNLDAAVSRLFIWRGAVVSAPLQLPIAGRRTYHKGRSPHTLDTSESSDSDSDSDSDFSDS